MGDVINHWVLEVALSGAGYQLIAFAILDGSLTVGATQDFQQLLVYQTCSLIMA